jgi:uncharacterized protein YxjI
MISREDMKKIFELHQKITAFANEYRVLNGETGQLTGYVKQKRFALREKFSLFVDEGQSDVIASSQARGVLDLAPIFDITDSNGHHLASVKKEFKKSLLSSTWIIYKDQQLTKQLIAVNEKSKFVAGIRRLWGFIPYAGDIPYPFKYHFSIFQNSKTVGEYQKITLFRDHYALYLEEKAINAVDEKVWMVLAVLLDAMQSR